MSQHRKERHISNQCAFIASSADRILPLTAAAVHSVKVNCQSFSKLSRLSILPHQHGIPDSGNLFCEILRTSNEEMKHGGTMTDHGQREPYRGKEEY